MKILLTGYKGFIGSNMYKHLLEQGHEVHGVEMNEVIPPVFKFDRIMHIGAISSTTETNVEKIMKYNYNYSVDLFERANYWGIPFQFSSSASVYGLKTEFFKEDSPVDPKTPYAWSKYMFENYIKNKITKSNVQMFRYFNVYGPNEEHKGTQASPYCQFTQQAKNTGKIRLFENSEKSHRDFIHVDELIDIQTKFMHINTSGVFNVGTGKTKSFQMVGEEIAKEYNADIEYIPMPKNLKHSYQEYTCADMSKTQNIFKFNIDAV